MFIAEKLRESTISRFYIIRWTKIETLHHKIKWSKTRICFQRNYIKKVIEILFQKLKSKISVPLCWNSVYYITLSLKSFILYFFVSYSLFQTLSEALRWRLFEKKSFLRFPYHLQENHLDISLNNFSGDEKFQINW